MGEVQPPRTRRRESSPEWDVLVRGLNKWPAVVILLVIYLLIAYCGVMGIHRQTVLQPPNQVLGPVGAPFGGFILLGLLAVEFCIGLLGFFFAYVIRRIGAVFVALGIVIMASAISNPYLVQKYGNQEERFFDMPDRDFFVGAWEDDNGRLELFADSTYTLSVKSDRRVGKEHSGKWDMDSMNLYLYDSACADLFEWEISKCNDLFFITYSHVGNADAWDGNLGLGKVPD